MDTIKYLVSEDLLPTAWYNIQADLSTPLPPVLHPDTGQPITPDDLTPLFPMSLIRPLQKLDSAQAAQGFQAHFRRGLLNRKSAKSVGLRFPA